MNRHYFFQKNCIYPARFPVCAGPATKIPIFFVSTASVSRGTA
jgi:hypothetical protein